jgi:hypothetical protein
MYSPLVPVSGLQKFGQTFSRILQRPPSSVRQRFLGQTPCSLKMAPLQCLSLLWDKIMTNLTCVFVTYYFKFFIRQVTFSSRIGISTKICIWKGYMLWSVKNQSWKSDMWLLCSSLGFGWWIGKCNLPWEIERHQHSATEKIWLDLAPKRQPKATHKPILFVQGETKNWFAFNMECMCSIYYSFIMYNNEWKY